MKTRSNFYIDFNRIEALKCLADAEETSVSELVREGIDRVISDRMNRPPKERAELRASTDAFLKKNAGSGAQPRLSEKEIERLVTEVGPTQSANAA